MSIISASSFWSLTVWDGDCGYWPAWFLMLLIGVPAVVAGYLLLAAWRSWWPYTYLDEKPEDGS
jgi:hypothetical protein